ncbi:MAG: hypothetical protein WEA31_07580 [Pirellulales bacterium]
MVAITRSDNAHQSANDRFLSMLPRIQRLARRAFRDCLSEQRDELVAEVVANSYCAFIRLVERDKQDVAFATPLANFAIRQVRCGRRVGAKLNVRDISSPHSQLVHDIYQVRLDRYNAKTGDWHEVLVEDRRASPADIAAVRIDFAAWLRSLPDRLRRIALFLASGETTSAAAKQFGLTPGRISQMRRELMAAWEAFHGEGCPATA